MHLVVDNVCQALPAGLEVLMNRGEEQSSRAGDVKVMPWPVITEYRKPTERVLFCPIRDANPFFHLAEALWMLAGRNDAAFLNLFVKDFGDRFADGGVVHGAYGHRWRHAFGFDQLKTVIEKLRNNPQDRQCVIQMWDAYPPTRYLTNGGEANCGADDLRGSWKDRPCNTHIYLRVRKEGVDHTGDYMASVLDITVCNRSNDIIWGAYGANAVHMSVLQEYLAAMIGVGVGRYYQFSNNYHVYLDEVHRLLGRAKAVGKGKPKRGVTDLLDDRYGKLAAQPLVHNPETFDTELADLLQMIDKDNFNSAAKEWKNEFLSETAYWVFLAHSAWRAGNRSEAFKFLRVAEASDWRVACTEWFERRMEAKKEKEARQHEQLG